MEVIESGHKLRAVLDEARAGGSTVGFVPTMGAFHEGHRSLMRRAVAERDLAVVSIFVNPLQFGVGEDFDSYPRPREEDLLLAGDEGVRVAFVPEAGDLYPEGAGTEGVTVDPGPIGDRLEGASRPGHFRGVATVVAKLFNLVGPCAAYFGEKDAQQLAVVRRMVKLLDYPVDVIGCPTIREPDGVAMSSRNAYLGPEDRAAATCLYRALSHAAGLAESGERDARVLRAEIAALILAEPRAALDYAAVVDEGTFQEIEELAGPARALVAARFGPARLIDNMPLPDQEEGTQR